LIAISLPAVDWAIPETLMVAFQMIVLCEFGHRAAQMSVAQREDLRQTLRLDRTHESRRKENIRKVEVIEYPELGMEAILKIEVEDFPAFILVDDKGNDFFTPCVAPTTPVVA
jgi:hypothetical protein